VILVTGDGVKRGVYVAFRNLERAIEVIVRSPNLRNICLVVVEPLLEAYSELADDSKLCSLLADLRTECLRRRVVKEFIFSSFVQSKPMKVSDGERGEHETSPVTLCPCRVGRPRLSIPRKAVRTLSYRSGAGFVRIIPAGSEWIS